MLKRGITKEVARMPYKGKDIILKVLGEGLTVKFYFGKKEEDLQQIVDTQDLRNFGDEIVWGFNGMYATLNGLKIKQLLIGLF